MGEIKTVPALVKGETEVRPRGAMTWRIGKVLVTAGAVSLPLAFWLFFVTVSDGTHALRLNPGDMDFANGGLAWGVATTMSVLILPFVWLLKQPRLQLTAGALIQVCAGFAIGELQSRLGAASRPGDTLTLVDDLVPHMFTVAQATDEAASLWLARGVIAMLGVGLILMIVGAARGYRREEHSGFSAGNSLPGAGALTFGLLLLLASVFLVGWAGDNCTATPLLASTCTGLTFNGVEYYGILTHTDLFDPIASLHAIPLLVAGGAALILLALWWRRRATPGLCLWITLYLAAATFFCVVALAGVGAVSDHSSALGLQAGTWRGQTGAYVAAGGLLVAWLALVSLWYATLRRREPPKGATAGG